MNRSDTPVIVVGYATTALSVLRLVANLGNPVFAACPPKTWPTRTRYFQPLPETEAGTWTGELGEAGYAHLRCLPFDRAIIIPAADDAGYWLSEMPADLRERYLVSGSHTRTLDLLQDKSEFSVLTAELDVATPRSFRVDTRDELEGLAIDWSADYFIKPRQSQVFNRKLGVKALRFSDKDEALRAWDAHDLQEMGILVQEYVPGGADQHYFIDGFRDRHGTFSVRLARRRLRMYPLDFGDSSLCRSIDANDVEPAWQGLKRILENVGYRGIFSAEFKHDCRDGKFKLIEINTRPWVYIQFADVCGVNMCDLYIRDALGESVPDDAVPVTGEYCVNLAADINAILNTPRADRPAFLSCVPTWFRSFNVLFDWADPRPALVGILNVLRSGMGRVFGRQA